MITDVFFTTLGERAGRPYERLWAEDSFGRLTRNDWTPDTRFDAVPRAGLGLVLRQNPAGQYKVTPRHRGCLISVERRDLSAHLHARELRVRVCVKSVVVMPCLRRFHIRQPNAEVWSISGTELATPAGTRSILTPAPMVLRQTPQRIALTVSMENVVFATEIIGNVKPAEVTLAGEPNMVTVCEQFLAATGYASTEGAVWRR